MQVAEDTLVDLDGLEFRGRSWQSVRSAINRAGKEGVTYRMVVLADQSWSLVTQVRAVSEEWVGGKGMPEMGFTLGGVDEALDPRTRVGLAMGADGSVQGVTSWLTVHNGHKRPRLDPQRHAAPHRGLPSGHRVPDRVELPRVPAEGARFVSLSGAPRARPRHWNGCWTPSVAP